MSQSVHILGNPHASELVENPGDTGNAVLDFFLGYWRRSLAGAALPLNASFEPTKVRGHLQWVTTADALPGYADFRYRVVASRANDYFEGDSTGKTVTEAYATIDRGFTDQVLWMLRRACETRLPLRLTGPASRISNIYFPSFDALYLPYSSDGAHADRVVNVFWYDQAKMMARSKMAVMPVRQ